MLNIREGLNLTQDGLYIIPTWKNRTICYIGYCENGALRLPIDGYLPIEDDMYMTSLDPKSNWNINSIILQLQTASKKILPVYLSNYTVEDVQDKLIVTNVANILSKLHVGLSITIKSVFKNEFINLHKK